MALIEYKDRRAATQVLTHPSYLAITKLADGYCDGALPFLLVRYDSDDWWFEVTPVNDEAKRRFKAWPANHPITEQKYVGALYSLRKGALTAADRLFLAKLSDKLPEQAVS